MPHTVFSKTGPGNQFKVTPKYHVRKWRKTHTYSIFSQKSIFFLIFYLYYMMTHKRSKFEAARNWHALPAIAHIIFVGKVDALNSFPLV